MIYFKERFVAIKKLTGSRSMAGVLLSLFACGCATGPQSVPPTTSPTSPRILGISHVAVKATDVEKSVAFYRDFLGFAEEKRLNYPADGGLMLVIMKVNDEQFLEIFNAAKLKPESDKLYQVAFRVEDAEAVRARLIAGGYPGKLPPRVPLGLTKNANFSAKDPHGYNIEFVQYRPEGLTRQDKGKFLSESRISERIIHAGVVVDDMPAADHFYHDLLGFRESWRGSIDDKTLAWIHMRAPEGCEFVEFMLDPKVVPHFCLEAADMEKAKAKLEATAYRAQYIKSIEIKTGRNHKRQINLYDPEGIRVELMEPDTVDGNPVPSSNAPLPRR